MVHRILTPRTLTPLQQRVLLAVNTEPLITAHVAGACGIDVAQAAAALGALRRRRLVLRMQWAYGIRTTAWSLSASGVVRSNSLRAALRRGQ